LTTKNEEERITIILKEHAVRMTEDGDSLVVYKSSELRIYMAMYIDISSTLCMCTRVCILRVGTLLYYAGYFFPLSVKRLVYNSAADTSRTHRHTHHHASKETI